MAPQLQIRKHHFLQTLHMTLQTLKGLRRAVPVSLHRRPHSEDYRLRSDGSLPSGAVVRVMPGATLDLELPTRHSDQATCPLCQSHEVLWALQTYAGRRDLRLTARTDGDPRWISVVTVQRHRVVLDVRALWAPPAQWVDRIPNAQTFTPPQRDRAQQLIEERLEQGYGFQCCVEEPIGTHLVRRLGLDDMLEDWDGAADLLGGCGYLCRWIAQAEEAAIEEDRHNQARFRAWLESLDLQQILALRS